MTALAKKLRIISPLVVPMVSAVNAPSHSRNTGCGQEAYVATDGGSFCHGDGFLNFCANSIMTLGVIIQPVMANGGIGDSNNRIGFGVLTHHHERICKHCFLVTLSNNDEIEMPNPFARPKLSGEVQYGT